MHTLLLSLNFTANQLLHVAGFTGPTSVSTQLYTTAA